MAQVMALRQGVRQQGQALRRGDQHADIAVAQDVGHLLGLEQRVERHEDAAGGRRAKAGDHRLETLFQIDRDALAALQAKTDQAAGKIIDGGLQFTVIQGGFAVSQGGSLWRTVGGAGDQVR